MNTRYLVTGASGFIGARLCARLLREGASVVATSRSTRASEHPALQWRRNDLLDADAVRQLIDSIQPDVVFHLAGCVSASQDRQLVLPTFSSLLASTVNILSAVTASCCRRIITIGSLTEPASGSGEEPIPGSPYAAAKWSASAYARMFHQLYETPVVIVRPYMTYGPGQHETKLVPYTIQALLRGVGPEIASGRWQADWIYVDDVVEGLLSAARCEGIEGRTIDLGTGNLTSIGEVVHKLVELVDPAIVPRFGTRPDRSGEPTRIADLTMAKQLLDWSPDTSLDAGLAATVGWHREHFNKSNEG